jgi:hypothetical protein
MNNQQQYHPSIEELAESFPPEQFDSKVDMYMCFANNVEPGSYADALKLLAQQREFIEDLKAMLRAREYEVDE